MGSIETVIPIEVRGINGVDRLKQQISILEAEVLKAQRSCQHDMRLLMPLPPLQESLVKGIFFLSKYPLSIDIRCLKCSNQIGFDHPAARLICPRCLGKLQWLYESGNFFPADSWARGFFNDPARYNCTECGLKYVWPEYSCL